MKSATRSRSLCYLALVLTLCWAGGCAAPKPNPRPVDESEMRHIHKAQALAQSFQQDKANKGKELNTENVKAWAVKSKGAKAEDFQSTRDGKEYVMAPGGMGPIVYEADGSGGERYVAAGEQSGLKSDEELDKLLHQKTGPDKQARRGGG